VDSDINSNQLDDQENNDDKIMINIKSNDNEILILDDFNENNYESEECESDQEVLILDNVIDFPKQTYIIETSNHFNHLKNTHKMELSNLNVILVIKMD
jgi:hypothetical protein